MDGVSPEGETTDEGINLLEIVTGSERGTSGGSIQGEHEDLGRINAQRLHCEDSLEVLDVDLNVLRDRCGHQSGRELEVHDDFLLDVTGWYHKCLLVQVDTVRELLGHLGPHREVGDLCCLLVYEVQLHDVGHRPLVAHVAQQCLVNVDR